MWRFLCLVLFITATRACVQRQAQYGSICVCNATYCDTVPSIGNIPDGSFKMYLTSHTSPGFTATTNHFNSGRQNGVTLVKVNKQRRFQTILGFGGAFTDSTGANIKLLPEPAQRKLVESYFGDDGIEYSVQRVPFGGADFSPSFYTLDEHPNDMELKYFALHQEDLNHKLPFMKMAFEMRKKKPLRLFTSVWNIPAWMRYDNGYTILKKTHYQVYANYYKKYFDEYAKHGIKFWGMTTQNEQGNALTPGGMLSVFWIPDDLNVWIRDHLGPTLKNSGHNISIILHDDNWGNFPFVAHPIVNDPKTVKYISGLAFHWYSYGLLPFEATEIGQNKERSLFMMNSEACFFVTKPFLGDWGRAAKIIKGVMDHLENGFHSFIDWNLAVNSNGGPNHLGLGADAPIVISANNREFYKQPYFYVFGHFTKFLPPGSVRVETDIENRNPDLRVISFTRPDHLTSVIVTNTNMGRAARLQLANNGKFSPVLNIPPASIQTFLFK